MWDGYLERGFNKKGNGGELEESGTDSIGHLEHLYEGFGRAKEKEMVER